MGKGIVFTIDAILAAVVAGALLVGIVLSFNNAEAEFSPVVTMRQTAEDVLTAMDKQGVLKTVFAQSDADAHGNLSSFLNSTLPLQLSGNFTVEVFEYETSGSCSASCTLGGAAPVNSFCACRRIINNTGTPCGTGGVSCRQMAQARRMFYQFVGGEDRLGRATLEVWTK